MVSIQVFATPTIGRDKSSSVKPIAFAMERAPARSRPSKMVRLGRFASLGMIPPAQVIRECDVRRFRGSGQVHVHDLSRNTKLHNRRFIEIEDRTIEYRNRRR